MALLYLSVFPSNGEVKLLHCCLEKHRNYSLHLKFRGGIQTGLKKHSDFRARNQTLDQNYSSFVLEDWALGPRNVQIPHCPDSRGPAGHHFNFQLLVHLSQPAWNYISSIFLLFPLEEVLELRYWVRNSGCLHFRLVPPFFFSDRRRSGRH